MDHLPCPVRSSSFASSGEDHPRPLSAAMRAWYRKMHDGSNHVVEGVHDRRDGLQELVGAEIVFVVPRDDKVRHLPGVFQVVIGWPALPSRPDG
jgi:hypothetical protein